MHWTVVRETPTNVGTALNDALHGIEAANQQGPKLLYNSPMEACVVICRSRKPAKRAGQLLFTDAVDQVARRRSMGFLQLAHLERILAAYQGWQD